MEPASEKVTWNVKTNSAGNTTADSFFSEDSLNRIDLGKKAELKWSYQKTHMVWDRREPALRSRSETQILDYMHISSDFSINVEICICLNEKFFFIQNGHYFLSLQEGFLVQNTI